MLASDDPHVGTINSNFVLFVSCQVPVHLSAIGNLMFCILKYGRAMISLFLLQVGCRYNWHHHMYAVLSQLAMVLTFRLNKK